MSLVNPLAPSFGLHGAAFSPSPSPAPPPQWIAVRERFRQFDTNLTFTATQRADALSKAARVIGCLDRRYYPTSQTQHGFLVGSWGKGTAARPPRDLDLYFVLPPDVHARFQRYAWNRQSALLQEVKEVLTPTFPQTDMRGDGQVVAVDFHGLRVEVVPAFEFRNGQYCICNTHDGGAYIVTDPRAELAHIEAVETANNGNLRPLIRMLKAWQNFCSVPLESFKLELLTANFLQQSEWRLKGHFYYDWLLRDFFAYLYGQAGRLVFVPGTREAILLGDDWQSRALTAYERAVRACDDERDNYVFSAGEEWQKIFGTDIPRGV